MVKKSVLAFLGVAIVAVFLNGCKEPKTEGNFKITLEGNFNSQSVSLGTTNVYISNNTDFYFTKLKFYLSHIKLIKTDNTEVEISDAAFFDYNDSNWKSVSAKVKEGDYKGIKFGVGLDATQNQIDPDTKPASDPLGPKNDMYWTWLKHRFVVLEGGVDITGNNLANASPLNYHLGRDTCYREVSLSDANFSIVANGGKELKLKIDFEKIFSNTNNPINPFTTSGTQSEDADLNVAIHFATNFSQAFSYSE